MLIAFIGLGNMGRHMAANLQKAGHDLIVHDVRPETAAGHLANGARRTYCANLALAEVFTLGVKAGVEPERLLEAIQGGAYGQGNMLKQRIPDRIFKGGFDQAGFYLALARKDVGLATELAREFNVPMKVAGLAEQALIEGLARGWDAKDASAIWMLQEERAGVKVRTE